MKRIGLIGGMSWESTAEYYRIINQTVNKQLGGSHSARILMDSIDFQELADLQHSDRWAEAGQMVIDAAKRLHHGGCALLLICANTMHIAYEDVRKAVPVPVIHICDATADAVKKTKMKRLGLLGTRFVMEKDFYKAVLVRHGLEILVPGPEDRKIVHEVIFKELVNGIISPSSKQEFIRIVRSLKEEGAEGVILGCTEIPALIGESDCGITLFDTTAIHAGKAVEMSLSQ